MQQNGLYYSRDNGFACAAAAKGVPEALQEHLNVIIRDKELVTEKVISEIQAEIKALAEDKEALEQQKLECLADLDERVKDVATKDTRLAELQKEMENPLNIDLEADSQIKALQDKINENTSKLEDNTSELEVLQEEHAKIETDLEAPTQAELEPVSIEGHPISQSTRLEKGFACLTAVVLVGLIIYLFIFYASVGDRTFTVGIGTIQEKTQIIIPRALSEAWEVKEVENDAAKDYRNWFVITFPFIFLTLAIIAYYCHEHKAWKILAGILVATFFIDAIIAFKISEQMHEFTKGDGVPYKISENLTEVLSVLFLGFGVALLLSYGLYWFMKVWKGVRPNQDAETQLAKLIRAEKNDRLIELNALKIRIQNLQDKNNDLKTEKQRYQDEIELAFKKPIEVEIAGLQTDRERMQAQIQNLNEQIEALQKEVDRCETEIEVLVSHKDKKTLNTIEMQKRSSEFVAGWCDYISQSKTELPETHSQNIAAVHNVEKKTLTSYIESFQYPERRMNETS